jgi:hypothetical protein
MVKVEGRPTPGSHSKSLRAPPGRQIDLFRTPAELRAEWKKGELVPGSVIGLCSPDCGELTIRQANEGGPNGGRWYACCSGRKEDRHNAFLWMDEDAASTSGTPAASTARALFPQTRVPHTIVKGAVPQFCIPSLVIHADGEDILLYTRDDTKLVRSTNATVYKLVQQKKLFLGAIGGQVVQDTLGMFSEVTLIHGVLFNTPSFSADREHFGARRIQESSCVYPWRK